MNVNNQVTEKGKWPMNVKKQVTEKRHTND